MVEFFSKLGKKPANDNRGSGVSSGSPEPDGVLDTIKKWLGFEEKEEVKTKPQDENSQTKETQSKDSQNDNIEIFNNSFIFMKMAGLENIDLQNITSNLSIQKNDSNKPKGPIEIVVKKMASGLVETIDSDLQYIEKTGNSGRLDLALKVMHGMSYMSAAARGAVVGTYKGGTVPVIGPELGGVIGSVIGVTQNYAVEKISDEGINLVAQGLRNEFQSLNEREAEYMALFGLMGVSSSKGAKEYLQKSWSKVKAANEKLAKFIGDMGTEGLVLANLGQDLKNINNSKVGKLHMPANSSKQSSVFLNEKSHEKSGLHKESELANISSSTPTDPQKQKAIDIVHSHKANQKTLSAQYKPLEEFKELGPAINKAIEHLEKIPGFEEIKDPIKQNKFIRHAEGLKTNGYVLGDGKYEIRINKAKPGAKHNSQKIDYVVIKENQVILDKNGNYIKEVKGKGIYIEDKVTKKQTFITDEKGKFLEEKYKGLEPSTRPEFTPHAHIPLTEFMKMEELWKKK